MNAVAVLNVTNIALGLATLLLWGMIATSIVQEMRDRRKRRHERAHRPQLKLVPPPSKAA